jgi:outer membrane lipase/esterase
LPENPFRNIFIFGDSLSDTGNVYTLSEGLIPISPPFFDGRYSNGQLWTEVFSGAFGFNATPSLKGGNNYAYAGARTGVDLNKAGKVIPSLLSQQRQFEQLHPFGGPSALYLIWGGTNDYYAVDGLSHPTKSDAVKGAGEAVQNLSQLVRKLIRIRADTILLLNLPDLGRAPGILHPDLATAFTAAFNTSLEGEMERLRSGNTINISVVDIFSLFARVTANPGSFGLQNVTGQCLDGNDLDGGTPCSQPEQYWYWYAVHPTGAGHQIIGQWVLSPTHG